MGGKASVLVAVVVQFDGVFHLLDLPTHGVVEGEIGSLAGSQLLDQFPLEVAVKLFAEVVGEGLFLLAVPFLRVLQREPRTLHAYLAPQQSTRRLDLLQRVHVLYLHALFVQTLLPSQLLQRGV